ncbi:gamma-glutamyl-gamma-aminobutyrate hydrolase family protein [Thermoactinomyces mirandus]|uniref:Gamma-glutamyl-gamma-aminobutyrate hydrolase family protein n=1 Tax=Thermoactinomyces mirandus TaxID=2756294 RepID=A0A7W2AT76_9BACL|nr:gamma-glutamyl-gamma-aminobutyrate hydrolase family protein [Thermoactinomyces mirandus]MBA4603455.1 gamma-glutamyl-gamma-aminobutyrate hydrolase family protein [Thermoactinomyces mirandus]
MKPLIGLTMSLEEEKKQCLGRSYTDSVLQAGGIPLLIPYIVDDQALQQLSRKLDGLILTGGGDIDPTLFDEEPHQNLGEIIPDRDDMEIALIEQFMVQNKPIFGICRGCQILNIALGGDMYQDICSQKQTMLQHTQRAPRHHPSHTITIVENTLLHSIYAKGQAKVNSFHHQAVRNVKPSFQISAVAKDGIIEAFESSRHDFVLGVQWHPEEMVPNDTEAVKLFQAFVNACIRRKEKQIDG